MDQLELIQSKIYEIRGQRVMLDFDLAELYQVETRALNQAVKRNSDRFPSDFMFQVDAEEWRILKSQFVISSWGGNRKLPYASRMQLELINLSTRKTLCSKSHGMSFQDAKLAPWTKGAETISNICHLPLLNWELLSFKCILNLFDKTYEKYVLYICYISLYANVMQWSWRKCLFDKIS